jgi:tetratricopeptide (TPR) repeat protein
MTKITSSSLNRQKGTVQIFVDTKIGTVSFILTLMLWLGFCLPTCADGAKTFEQKSTAVFSFWEQKKAVSFFATVPTRYADKMDGSLGLEERLIADAEDGGLFEFSLLDAALIAGGADDPVELGRYRRRMAEWIEELRQKKLDGSPQQKAKAVFDFLHAQILKGKYDIKCTDIRQTMDKGRFNCLSATVLYNCLIEEMGFSCCALESPGHVSSRIFLPGGALDVETTCPRWFRLQREQLANNAGLKDTNKGTVPFSLRENRDSPQRENRDSPQRENRDSPQRENRDSPQREKVKKRQVTPVQLTAMIYYNRGIDFLAEKRFADAAAANAKALRLDPSNTAARGNFLATINNWAVELAKAGQYARAAALLEQGLAYDPHYEAFARNFAYVRRQWPQARQIEPLNK